MRVLVFLSSAAVGGTERMTITLVNHLVSGGCQTLLVLGSGGHLEREVAPHVEVTQLGIRRVRHAVLPLVCLIRRWGPDVVFASKPDANIGLALAWRLTGRRAKLVVRESNYRTAQGFAHRGLFARVLRWVYGQADVVVAPSRVVARDLMDRYALHPTRIKVIYNPVDCNRILDASEDKSQLPPPSEKPHGGVQLIGVGRLVRQKGFDILLKALARLRNGDVHLTILGDGPERVALRELAEELGIASQVSMPGFVPNPYPWIVTSEVFVLSSRWEGFPNVLVEAMVCGLPVVATRCPAGPEEIVTHEYDGLLCGVESAEALAAELTRLIYDRAFARRLGRTAQETAQRFDAGRVVDEYVALFREVTYGHAGAQGIGSAHSPHEDQSARS